MQRELTILTRFHQSTLLILAGAIAAALAGCRTGDDRSTEFPRRPIKVIVPFAAGGGSDTFGRVIASAIDEHQLLPHKLVIINVPGAGGTIGSRRVKNAVPDGYTVLLLHEGILTAKYSGQAPYGPEVFQPIAGTGNAPQIIAVSQDSPLADLAALMNAVSDQPDEIVYAANIGAPSYFAGLMLEQQKPGAAFRYTQTGGGAKRFEAIKGGHVDVSSFSLAEYAAFRAAGLRALAVLSPSRHPDFPGLPTAREQGLDVVSENMQYWWAPRETPPDRIAIIAQAIQRAMQLAEVQGKLSNMRINPRLLRGQQLREDIQRRSVSIAAVSPRKIDELPNFPLITLLITVLLGIAACWSHGRAVSPRAAEKRPTERRAAAAAALLTMVYVATLQVAGAPFVAATAVFIFLVGMVIAAATATAAAATATATAPATRLGRIAACLAASAVLIACGIHYVFTRILVVDLP